MIEIVWTTVSVIGLATTVWLLYQTVLDRRALRAAGRNGPGELLARALIRVEALRVAQLAIMVAIGIVALASADGTRSTRIVVLTGLILVAILTTVNALFDRHARGRVDAAIVAIYDAGGIYLDTPKENRQ